MLIDWANFTPVSSALGGALIGLAALLLYLFNGRIMGASGILGQALAEFIQPVEGNRLGWRVVFLLSMLAGPSLYLFFTGQEVARVQATSSPAMLALAGLIVGLGTGLGSGCTSGHGICGLARFSKRSLAAVLVFMAFGFLTVYALRVWGGQ
jgi:uncharacterized membrane protein YedE/YeeE